MALERPTDPLDLERLPRLTVFGLPWCEETALTRSRLEALNVPFLYVDLEADPRADAYVREQRDGNRITPIVVVGVEEAVAAEPDLATVDALAALAWPDLPIERPGLSAPLGTAGTTAGLDPDTGVQAERPVTPHGLVDVPAGRPAQPMATYPAIPVRWAAGPAGPTGAAGHVAVVLLAHGGGCLACLGFAKRLLAERAPLAGAGATAAVVVADGPDAALQWRRDLPADARVLADAAGAWQARTLNRLLGVPGAPGSAIRFADGGVALLVIDVAGRVRRMAAGPEAGYLPDPASVADAVALEDARDSLRLGR